MAQVTAAGLKVVDVLAFMHPRRRLQHLATTSLKTPRRHARGAVGGVCLAIMRPLSRRLFVIVSSLGPPTFGGV